MKKEIGMRIKPRQEYVFYHNRGMHLLVDVRMTSPSDLPFLQYGLLWSDIWMQYHPNDSITFLAHDDDKVEKYDTIRVKNTWHSFGRKYIANHHHGPDRIISFSRLPAFDDRIKHISHISDLTPLLYPSSPLGALEYRWRMREYREFFKKSHRLILPHLDVVSGINELFEVDEKKITIIPYLSPLHGDIHKLCTILPHGIYGNYFITEGNDSLEWRPLELLEAFATYIHRMGGKEKLIILGYLGENLGMISSMIRTLDLLDFVKIIGILERDERELIYVHARGWIYAGSYYSRGPSVALASGFGVPLYFTDIPGLRNYSGIYFHANHLDRLPDLLRTEKDKYQIQLQANNESIMGVYARIISE